jgi:flagellar biosynthesis protein
MATDPGAPAPPLRAVALSYGQDEAQSGLAPRIAASGQGIVAEAIIARAREHGVPVHESRELVAALMHFDLDEHIPPALYVAVAELLVWVRRQEAEASGRPGDGLPG